MIRKQIRMRREFLYRKGLEERQRAMQDRREKVKNAIEKNQQIPNEMKSDGVSLLGDVPWGTQTDNVDDEYRWAGCDDPTIVVTTSREPSSKLKMFAKVRFKNNLKKLSFSNNIYSFIFKEVKLLLPNSRRINRGSHDIKSITDACKANGVGLN